MLYKKEERVDWGDWGDWGEERAYLAVCSGSVLRWAKAVNGQVQIGGVPLSEAWEGAA